VKKWLNRALVVAGLAVMAWVVSQFPLSAIRDACLQLGPWVFVTPLVALGWFSASSWSLYYLLDGKAPWSALLYNRIVGEGYNALLPAAGVGGEPFKLKLLGRYVDTHRAVVALINDRIVENGIALAFSAACVGGGAYFLDVAPALRATMVMYAIGGGLAALACAALLLTSITSRIGGRISKWIGAAVGQYERMPLPVLARSFGCTLIARLCGLVETAILFHLLGLDYTLFDVVFTGGAIAAAGFVGGVIPQGIGVTEAATVGVLEMLHFPGQAGVAFALAKRGRQLVVSVAGVLLHVATQGQSDGQISRSSTGSHVPSPHLGASAGQLAFGGHSGEQRAQQSGSAQPARPSPSSSSVAMRHVSSTSVSD
jgi:hypothetical protein